MTETMENVAGLILAQGGSTRMGCDKAELVYEGESFLSVAVQRLKSAGVENVYINNAANLADIIPDIGPLGGIYTALKSHVDVECWVILPVDMPLMSVEILMMLSRGLGNADMVRFDGEMFPLVVKTSDAVLAHIGNLAIDTERTYSMRQFMKPFEVKILSKPMGSEVAFRNINTPEDYEAICG